MNAVVTTAIMIWRIIVPIGIVPCLFSPERTRRERFDANMPKTEYSAFDELNELQTKIMNFIDKWVREIHTPVPRKEVMSAFADKLKPIHHPAITVEGALNALLHKGYIRRAYSGSNKTYYVQLKSLHI